ncbi:hypothetical protein P3538_21490 [Vibrio parahaemolyticus]|nr:hypothetical protein [Vibrio parahaemolyticus]
MIEDVRWLYSQLALLLGFDGTLLFAAVSMGLLLFVDFRKEKYSKWVYGAVAILNILFVPNALTLVFYYDPAVDYTFLFSK